MTKVRIIASFHKEIESINHLELLEILKRFSPDIIFEEFDNKTFEIIYNEQKSFTLEPKAIMHYLKQFNIAHKPVDTYSFSDRDFENYKYVINIIGKTNPEYRILVENQFKETLIGGFQFLNSIENNQIIEWLQQVEMDVLNKLNDSNCYNIYKKWQNITFSRERTFIENINRNLESTSYKNAVFITGAEHKYSLEKHLDLNALYPEKQWIYGLD